ILCLAHIYILRNGADKYRAVLLAAVKAELFKLFLGGSIAPGLRSAKLYLDRLYKHLRKYSLAVKLIQELLVFEPLMRRMLVDNKHFTVLLGDYIRVEDLPRDSEIFKKPVAYFSVPGGLGVSRVLYRFLSFSVPRI